MPRLALVILACLIAMPAISETAAREGRPAPDGKSLVDPATLSVNEQAAKKAQAETDARAKAWDVKLRKTMEEVCIGC